MLEAAAVYIVVLHFTIMGFSGRGLPDSERRAFASESDCIKSGIPAVRRTLKSLPMQPDKIVCEKMEIKR